MTTSTVKGVATPKRRQGPKVIPTPPPQAPTEPKNAEASSKPATSAPKTVATPKTGFRSKRVPLYHPYQNITIPTSRGVPLARDSWVEVQLAAKVIEEVNI